MLPKEILDNTSDTDAAAGRDDSARMSVASVQAPLLWKAHVAELQAKADKVIYLHTRVIYVGNVDLSAQTFYCRFDLFVAWDPLKCGTEDEFQPRIRFPQSANWSEVYRIPLESPVGRVGYRATIEGDFICALELEAFPFDAQAFDIVMELGREVNTNLNLSLDNGFKLEQNPNFANMTAPQISDQYAFRPSRYTLMTTSRLESPFPRSVYMLSIAATRKSAYYLTNHYFFVSLMFILSFSFFVLPVWDIANRLISTMTLFLILVAFKFSVAEGLPKIGYSTAFDLYVLFSFAHLLLDPVIWAGIYVWADGIVLEEDAVSDLLPWNFYLFWFKVAFMIVGHVILFISARKHMAAQAEALGNMGTMDDQLKAILAANGVKFDASGAIKNYESYKRLLEQ